VLQRSYLGGMTLVGSAALALAILLMIASTPVGLGPLGVTGWFLLVLVGVSAVASVVAYGLAAWLRPHNTPKYQIKASCRRGVMVGGYITITLALNSLQQLNLRAIIILGLLLLLIEFYAVARS
jgi:hypothetical protein